MSSPVAKEPFRAKEKHPEYYASFLSAARLRYRLLPYIYSLARDVHETGRPFVRPAWIDFPGTPGATDDQTSIVFGPSLYTSIITRSIYTGHTTGSGSPVPSEMLTTPDGKAGVKVEFWMRTPEEVAKLERESRMIEVALPVGADWYDFRTGEKFAGGSKLQREYPIDSFPLFVKAGSVLPLGPDVQYATEKTDKPIGAREGSFPGMPKTHAFRVVCGDFSKSVSYDGSEVVLPAVSLADRSTSCMKSTTRCTSR